MGRLIDTTLLVRGRRFRTDVVYVDDELLVGMGFALLGRSGVFSQYREVAFMEKASPKVVEFRV